LETLFSIQIRETQGDHRKTAPPLQRCLEKRPITCLPRVFIAAKTVLEFMEQGSIGVTIREVNNFCLTNVLKGGPGIE
jgi:hypothetical protein